MASEEVFFAGDFCHTSDQQSYSEEEKTKKKRRRSSTQSIKEANKKKKTSPSGKVSDEMEKKAWELTSLKKGRPSCGGRKTPECCPMASTSSEKPRNRGYNSKDDDQDAASDESHERFITKLDMQRYLECDSKLSVKSTPVYSPTKLWPERSMCESRRGQIPFLEPTNKTSSTPSHQELSLEVYGEDTNDAVPDDVNKNGNLRKYVPTKSYLAATSPRTHPSIPGKSKQSFLLVGKKTDRVESSLLGQSSSRKSAVPKDLSNSGDRCQSSKQVSSNLEVNVRRQRSKSAKADVHFPSGPLDLSMKKKPSVKSSEEIGEKERDAFHAVKHNLVFEHYYKEKPSERQSTLNESSMKKGGDRVSSPNRSSTEGCIERSQVTNNCSGLNNLSADQDKPTMAENFLSLVLLKNRHLRSKIEGQPEMSLEKFPAQQFVGYNGRSGDVSASTIAQRCKSAVNHVTMYDLQQGLELSSHKSRAASAGRLSSQKYDSPYLLNSEASASKVTNQQPPEAHKPVDKNPNKNPNYISRMKQANERHKVKLLQQSTRPAQHHSDCSLPLKYNTVYGLTAAARISEARRETPAATVVREDKSTKVQNKQPKIYSSKPGSGHYCADNPGKTEAEVFSAIVTTEPAVINYLPSVVPSSSGVYQGNRNQNLNTGNSIICDPAYGDYSERQSGASGVQNDWFCYGYPPLPCHQGYHSNSGANTLKSAFQASSRASPNTGSACVMKNDVQMVSNNCNSPIQKNKLSLPDTSLSVALMQNSVVVPTCTLQPPNDNTSIEVGKNTLPLRITRCHSASVQKNTIKPACIMLGVPQLPNDHTFSEKSAESKSSVNKLEISRNSPVQNAGGDCSKDKEENISNDTKEAISGPPVENVLSQVNVNSPKDTESSLDTVSHRFIFRLPCVRPAPSDVSTEDEDSNKNIDINQSIPPEADTRLDVTSQVIEQGIPPEGNINPNLTNSANTTSQSEKATDSDQKEVEDSATTCEKEPISSLHNETNSGQEEEENTEDFTKLKTGPEAGVVAVRKEDQEKLEEALEECPEQITLQPEFDIVGQLLKAIKKSPVVECHHSSRSQEQADQDNDPDRDEEQGTGSNWKSKNDVVQPSEVKVNQWKCEDFYKQWERQKVINKVMPTKNNKKPVSNSKTKKCDSPEQPQGESNEKESGESKQVALEATQGDGDYGEIGKTEQAGRKPEQENESKIEGKQNTDSGVKTEKSGTGPTTDKPDGGMVKCFPKDTWFGASSKAKEHVKAKLRSIVSKEVDEEGCDPSGKTESSDVDETEDRQKITRLKDKRYSWKQVVRVNDGDRCYKPGGAHNIPDSRLKVRFKDDHKGASSSMPKSILKRCGESPPRRRRSHNRRSVSSRACPSEKDSANLKKSLHSLINKCKPFSGKPDETTEDSFDVTDEDASDDSLVDVNSSSMKKSNKANDIAHASELHKETCSTKYRKKKINIEEDIVPSDEETIHFVDLPSDTSASDIDNSLLNISDSDEDLLTPAFRTVPNESDSDKAAKISPNRRLKNKLRTKLFRDKSEKDGSNGIKKAVLDAERQKSLARSFHSRRSRRKKRVTEKKSKDGSKCLSSNVDGANEQTNGKFRENLDDKWEFKSEWLRSRGFDNARSSVYPWELTNRKNRNEKIDSNYIKSRYYYLIDPSSTEFERGEGRAGKCDIARPSKSGRCHAIETMQSSASDVHCVVTVNSPPGEASELAVHADITITLPVSKQPVSDSDEDEDSSPGEVLDLTDDENACEDDELLAIAMASVSQTSSHSEDDVHHEALKAYDLFVQQEKLLEEAEEVTKKTTHTNRFSPSRNGTHVRGSDKMGKKSHRAERHSSIEKQAMSSEVVPPSRESSAEKQRRSKKHKDKESSKKGKSRLSKEDRRLRAIAREQAKIYAIIKMKNRLVQKITWAADGEVACGKEATGSNKARVKDSRGKSSTHTQSRVAEAASDKDNTAAADTKTSPKRSRKKVEKRSGRDDKVSEPADSSSKAVETNRDNRDQQFVEEVELSLVNQRVQKCFDRLTLESECGYLHLPNSKVWFPYVEDNGYKYIPVKETSTLFPNCVPGCTIPKNVLLKDKQLAVKMCSHRQAHLFGSIWPFNGSCSSNIVHSGDLMIKWSRFSSNYRRIWTRIKDLHKDTPRKRSKVCNYC